VQGAKIRIVSDESSRVAADVACTLLAFQAGIKLSEAYSQDFTMMQLEGDKQRDRLRGVPAKAKRTFQAAVIGQIWSVVISECGGDLTRLSVDVFLSDRPVGDVVLEAEIHPRNR